MDPYSIPPVNAGSSASNDSDASDEVKSDERRHERSVAFRQAIERSRPEIVGPPVAAPAAPIPQGKAARASTARQTDRSGVESNGELADEESVFEGMPHPAEQAASRAPSLGAQASLDPALRQSLLRMQSEGVELPPSLLELLEQSDQPANAGVVAGKGKGAAPVGETAEQIEASEVSAETADAAAAERRLAVKSLHEGDEARSDSTSLGRSKSESKESVDGSADEPSQLSMPIAMQPLPTQLTGQVQHVPPPPPLVQELVEFATFGRNTDGNLEFRLGLVDSALGGLRIQLASYGNRRVGLKIKGSGGRSAQIGDAEIGGLIDALKAKNVEVVDVVRE